MYQRKKNWKRILLMLAFVLAFLPRVQSRAAEESIGALALFDRNGELITIWPAFAGITESAVYVYTSGDFDESTDFVTAAYITQIEQNQYNAEYLGNYNGTFSLWQLQDYVMDDSFFIEDLPHMNDEAKIYFHRMLDDLPIMSESTVLTGYQDGIVEASSYPENAESIIFPAPVVNSEDKLIGILAEAGVIVATAGDETTFYGSDGQDMAQPEEQTAAPINLPDPEPEPEPAPTKHVEIYLAIVLACIFFIAVCAFVFTRSRKRKGKNEQTPINPVNPSPVNPGMDIVEEPIKPTKPIPDEETPAYFIVAKDGYMKGRVYQMKMTEHIEITIGRNPEMTIQYPADTVGISRIHAKIFWQGNNLVLMDCKSTSGTFLQRTGRLTPMIPVTLQDGDVFYLGERKNLFEVGSAR